MIIKIIYFEYGGIMRCHYNPQQDKMSPEEWLNNLKVFRNGDVIRIDWQKRFININYQGGEQEIKVFLEEREIPTQGDSQRISYNLVKTLAVPDYQLVV